MAAETTTGATVGMEPGKVFPPLDPNAFAPQLFWLALMFGLLYVLMKQLALPKIELVIKERHQSIEGDLKAAEKLKAETQLALSRYELALSEARERAREIVKDLREKVAAEVETERAKHEALMSEKFAEAEQRIAQSKVTAIAGVNEIAPLIAGAIVTRLNCNRR